MRFNSHWCLELGIRPSTLLLNKHRMVGTSDLKLNFSIEDGSDPALGEGKLLFPSPTSGMKRILLWKWILRKHSLAQFSDIKGKRMSPLVIGVTSSISNRIWLVSHCCLKKNWIQAPLFFKTASQTLLWISKEMSLETTYYPAYRIIIWDLFSRNCDKWCTRHKTEVHEHCGQWEIGDRRKSAVSCSLCSSHGLVRGTIFFMERVCGCPAWLCDWLGLFMKQ